MSDQIKLLYLDLRRLGMLADSALCAARLLVDLKITPADYVRLFGIGRTTRPHFSAKRWNTMNRQEQRWLRQHGI